MSKGTLIISSIIDAIYRVKILMINLTEIFVDMQYVLVLLQVASSAQ